MEHRPRLEFYREPALVGQFQCSVDETAIRFHTGTIYVWAKNTKTGDAVNAFVAGPQLELVPDPKIGVKELDTVVPITDDICELNVRPEMKMFPLNGGQETMIEIRQGAGVRPLIPTKQATISFGKPDEPIQPADPKQTRSTLKLSNDTTFQLYAPMCVYYFDEEGKKHGTCNTYRFFKADGNADLACKESPISGTFERTLGGYCEN